VGSAVGAIPVGIVRRRSREGGLEALVVPALVAAVANKHKVGACPGVDGTFAAGDAVLALAFRGPGIAGRVYRQPVVAAAETGGGGTVFQRDKMAREVRLTSGGECGVNGSIVRALRRVLDGGGRRAAGGLRGAWELCLPRGGPVGRDRRSDRGGGERGQMGGEIAEIPSGRVGGD